MCRQVALFRALIRAFAILLENSGHLLASGEPVFSHVFGALVERFALIIRQAVHAPIFAAMFFTHVCKCTRRRQVSRAESRRARVAFQEAMFSSRPPPPSQCRSRYTI
jgi:hypothetical protein